LNVMANRLSRIVDRFRVLESNLSKVEDVAALQHEMQVLAHRERVIYWAISLCTICALLICVVIASLFVGAVSGVQSSALIASLFIAAMFALIVGLLALLREIYIATGSIHRVGKN
jgi:hypothetical protein